jgi:hypothetical protein
MWTRAVIIGAAGFGTGLFVAVLVRALTRRLQADEDENDATEWEKEKDQNPGRRRARQWVKSWLVAATRSTALVLRQWRDAPATDRQGCSFLDHADSRCARSQSTHRPSRLSKIHRG